MNLQLHTIWSGGQTGADRGGLDGALSLGLKTGGWAPKEYRTDDGNDPSLRDLGLRTTDAYDYGPRTVLNVQGTDATVLFGDPRSPGSVRTIKCVKDLNKPLLRLWWQPGLVLGQIDYAVLVLFLEEHEVGMLNWAGNRERMSPGIRHASRNFIYNSLRLFLT